MSEFFFIFFVVLLVLEVLENGISVIESDEVDSYLEIGGISRCVVCVE